MLRLDYWRIIGGFAAIARTVAVAGIAAIVFPIIFRIVVRVIIQVVWFSVVVGVVI